VTRVLRLLLPVLATTAVVLAGCGTSSGPKGSRTSATPAQSATTSTHSTSKPPQGNAKEPATHGHGWIPSLAEAPDDHMPGYDGACQVSQQSNTTHMCTFGDTTNPSLTVAVVGDSVANEWLGAIVAAGKTRHWKIVTDYHSRCPWSATMAVNTGETVPYTACHAWGEAAMQDILTTIKPDVVITSDRPVLGTVDYPTPGPESLAEIGHGMATYWHTLLDHNIAVVPIRESPEMGIDIPTCLRDNSVAACTVPASQAITPDPPTVVAARELGTKVHLVDMNHVICPHDTCKPVVGRIVKFRDLHHLTNTYVQVIAAKFATKLLATGAFEPQR
jgi:hypothetical protein